MCFFNFIDMQDNYPFTGTGNLYNFCCGLMKIGVLNQIIVIFDNDTAGNEKYEKLLQLPQMRNMLVTKLPYVSEFESVETIGPQGTSIENINGSAVAIECFLDFSTYHISPTIRWTNYVEKQSWFVEYDRLYFPNNENNEDGFKGAVVSPMFDLRGIEGANLKMKMLCNQTGTVTLKLSNDSCRTYSPLVEYNNLSGTKDVVINLTPYVGKVVNICIEGTATGIEDSYLIIDNFELELIESCSRPESIELTKIEGTSVDVKIVSSSDATAWQYVVVRDGSLGVESGTIVDVVTKEFTINNLAGFTKYRLFVRTNCGEKQSSWREVEFKTICAEENAIPYYESFENNECCFFICMCNFYFFADNNNY